MLQDLKAIEYRWGLLKPGMKPSDLPLKTWKSSNIPSEFIKQMHEVNLLNLGGSYGKKHLGDPLEYDHLRIILTDDVVEIEVYNRGICIMMNLDENVLSIHKAVSHLQNA
ncbi:hypothetical protein [Magnetococcus marinus]|uniref:hypothetical protein n=1 Tax=Magnetococcus marinus TaxID=1124597 RepID=UPI0005A2EF54|nr:hypothetical protein [Magnetococcus marinus]